jgi:microcin C transport system permease protein
MAAYILKRLLLMIPTLLGIILLNFLIVQAAPGGPVEQTIARLKGQDAGATARISGAGGDSGAAVASVGAVADATSAYRGAQGIDPELIAELNKMYGFDKPAHERFLLMLGNYLQGDLGTSYFRDTPVWSLILEKLPVSMSLGIWSTLIIYLISIPLGIAKARREGTAFDVWSSGIIIVGYAIPGFLFAMILIILFAGGSYWSWFPLRGLLSEGASEWPWWQQVLDYAWHMVLPTTALVISGFAGLTILTKNSFLEEMGKQYVLVARAKGLTEKQALWRHVFRNAMLIIIAGFPAALLGMLFTGALLIEVIFSLDGLGLLGYEAALSRDYPVMFGTLFLFTLLGMILKLIGDLAYVWVDPRIDFNTRG